MTVNFSNLPRKFQRYKRSHICIIQLEFSILESCSQDYTCAQNDHHFHEHTHTVEQLAQCSVEAISLFDKTLLKVVDTVDPGTINSSLLHASDFV